MLAIKFPILHWLHFLKQCSQSKLGNTCNLDVVFQQKSAFLELRNLAKRKVLIYVYINTFTFFKKSGQSFFHPSFLSTNTKYVLEFKVEFHTISTKRFQRQQGYRSLTCSTFADGCAKSCQSINAFLAISASLSKEGGVQLFSFKGITYILFGISQCERNEIKIVLLFSSMQYQ